MMISSLEHRAVYESENESPSSGATEDADQRSLRRAGRSIPCLRWPPILGPVIEAPQRRHFDASITHMHRAHRDAPEISRLSLLRRTPSALPHDDADGIGVELTLSFDCSRDAIDARPLDAATTIDYRLRPSVEMPTTLDFAEADATEYALEDAAAEFIPSYRRAEVRASLRLVLGLPCLVGRAVTSIVIDETRATRDKERPSGAT